MPYMDIWMYNSRPRMRVFLCYLLIFVAFFIFSDVMIFFYTKSLYKPIENYEVLVTTPQITVTLAEASNVNGNLKGAIKNNTNETMENQYIKFEFYSPRDVKMGTKYIEVGTLNPEEEKQYEFGFKFEKVSSVKISTATAEEVASATTEELEILPTFGPAGLLSAIILGYFFL